jgi:hypothetical protein
LARIEVVRQSASGLHLGMGPAVFVVISFGNDGPFVHNNATNQRIISRKSVAFSGNFQGPLHALLVIHDSKIHDALRERYL